MFGSAILRDALKVVIATSGPFLCCITLTALVFGIIQSATQVQESSVSFLPKFWVTVAVSWIVGPWVLRRLVEFLVRVLAATTWIG